MHSDYVLPFYVVCDESFSMMDHIDALNDGLLELHRAVGADPVVAERTRFCLIGFSESPQVRLPMCRLSDVTGISALTARAATNFGAVFAFLRDIITRDVDLLKERSHQVCRPAVFFLSDGQPTDPATWPKAHAALTDPNWAARPNVIAFGIGDADPVTIGRIGTFRAFMSHDGVSPGTALHEFARMLIAAMVLAADSSSAGSRDMPRVSGQISGFTALNGPIVHPMATPWPSG